MPESVRSVALVDSDSLRGHADRIASVQGRASQVMSLIRSCGLVRQARPSSSCCSDPLGDAAGAVVVPPAKGVDTADLERFHSSDYVQFLRELAESSDPEKLVEERGEEFGIGYDCPHLDGLLELCLSVAGASIAAADAAATGRFDVAINWCGGWHHAQRDAAEGFCYVNDAVLCIQRLRDGGVDRVLYVDLDVHHGNGVENAFAFSPKVFTLSLHLREAGFYPGTGAIEDQGMGKGRNFCLNVPLREGAKDSTFIVAFKRSFRAVISWFRPEAIVCQCGADSLAGDPLGGFNLTPDAIVNCVKDIVSLGLPTVLLGGGGYVNKNAAILWTKITATVVGATLDGEVPDCDPYFPHYGPSFDFDLPCGRIRDSNDPVELDMMLRAIQQRYDSTTS